MASADDDWYTDSEASDSEVSQGEDAQPEAQETRTTCDQCGKTRDSLKHCAKCKTTHYCDRDCQNAHWKTHKKECARLAGGEGASADGKVPKRSDAKPFTAIYHNNFLHHGTEKETFKILIDVIRMRQEDVYSLEGLSFCIATTQVPLANLITKQETQWSVPSTTAHICEGLQEIPAQSQDSPWLPPAVVV